MRRLCMLLSFVLSVALLVAAPAAGSAPRALDCLVALRLAGHVAAAPLGDCLAGHGTPEAYRMAAAQPRQVQPAEATRRTATLCGPAAPLYAERGCPDALTVIDSGDNGSTIGDENFRIGWEALYDVAVTGDGDLAVLTGATTTDRFAFEHDLLTSGVDVESGEEVWRAVLDNPAGGADYASTVLTSPDGATAYVSATMGLSRQEPPAAALVAYDTATGEQRWFTAYDVGRPDTGTYDFEAALSPDGSTIYVIGVTADTSGVMNSLLWAVDARTGAQRWALEQASPHGGYGLTTQVDVSPVDGTIYVAGTAWSPDQLRADVWARAVSPAGQVRWDRRFDGGSWDQTSGLAVSPDGASVAATSLSDNQSDVTNYVQGAQNRDWSTVVWDTATGDFRWQRRHGGFAGGDNRPFDLAFSPDSTTLYVAGAETTETVATVRYAIPVYRVDTGEGGTTYIYEGEARGAQHHFNVATDLAVDADGRVYVTGYSATLTPGNPVIASAGLGAVYIQNHPYDMATLAWDPNSAGGLTRRWVGRWNPSPAFNDQAMPAAMAIAPDTGALLLGATLLYQVSGEYADPDRPTHQNFFDVGLIRYDR